MQQTTQFPQIDDEALVVAALLGDLDAFDELVRRFRGAVTLVAAQALGRREGSEDVAQEAFLLAFKALPQLQEPSKFPAWLHAIARHRARRVAARERRAEPTEPSEIDRLLLAESRELAVPGPAEECARREERALVAEALAGLPPEHRTVLLLRYDEEWPVARIAEFLSLPITTVKWRLHHGRALLRRRLTEHEGEPIDGRRERGSSRDPSPAPPAARDRRAGGARQPDRQPVAGRPQRGEALQSDRRPS